VAEVELVEEETGEQGSGIGVRAMLSTKLPGIEQEFVGDLIIDGVNIVLTFGQDVPDGDEDFASDSDDGLLVTDTIFEALEMNYPAASRRGIKTLPQG
jgi:hypothetical protein